MEELRPHLDAETFARVAAIAASLAADADWFAELDARLGDGMAAVIAEAMLTAYDETKRAGPPASSLRARLGDGQQTR